MTDRYTVIHPATLEATLEAMRRAGHVAKLEARIEKLEAALRACHASLNVAFDYDGDVFGIHHNAAVDADIMVKQVLDGKDD
jgi:hypothetical protein